jgi:hypothetical protein
LIPCVRYIDRPIARDCHADRLIKLPGIKTCPAKFCDVGSVLIEVINSFISGVGNKDMALRVDCDTARPPEGTL